MITPSETDKITANQAHMSDAVYRTLIRLCTDICKRNGKDKLLWLGDKDKTLKYKPKPDEMVITVHRWFAKKSCPGEWLYSRLGDLAAKVTAELGGGSPSSDAVSTASGDDNEKAIWDYLYARIGNAYGTAGLMGNIKAESNCSPINLQDSYEKKLGLSDEEYTAKVDDGSYTDFVRDSAGYGLAQWTYHSRKHALLDFAGAQGKSIGDLSMQLDFLWSEFSGGYPAVLSVLKSATSVREAAKAVLTQYERPADQSEAVLNKRTQYGQAYFDKYVSSAAIPATASLPYQVKVAIPDLNIRTGPGISFKRTGKFTGVGVFTITQEQDGWGKLKSKAGWICLKYTSRI